MVRCLTMPQALIAMRLSEGVLPPGISTTRKEYRIYGDGKRNFVMRMYREVDNKAVPVEVRGYVRNEGSEAMTAYLTWENGRLGEECGNLYENPPVNLTLNAQDCVIAEAGGGELCHARPEASESPEIESDDESDAGLNDQSRAIGELLFGNYR
eukprot:gene3713-4653_t